ncbi:hypothetical protein RUM44_013770 [Polyplax serrata]|uniref:Uncharacterized protein n=1 Tax=Polyplax serrata TaxID=468196 RepID=A0ABR1BIR6_POLSC
MPWETNNSDDHRAIENNTPNQRETPVKVFYLVRKLVALTSESAPQLTSTTRVTPAPE